MNPALPVAFWALSMMFVITPGADWAYAISAGLLLGHLMATLIVAAGIGALVTSVPRSYRADADWRSLSPVVGYWPHPKSAGADCRGRRRLDLIGALDRQGLRGQRPQSEGDPAIPGATAAIRRHHSGVADPRADRRIGSGPCRQLRCRLRGCWQRCAYGAAHPATSGQGGRPGVGRGDALPCDRVERGGAGAVMACAVKRPSIVIPSLSASHCRTPIAVHLSRSQDEGC